jgi:type VI secretion system protein ImpG
VFLSLVDASMAPFRSDLRQLGLRALCTNRHLPIQMSVGVGRTDFTMDLSAPVNAIRILSGPTLPRPSVVLSGTSPDRPDIPAGRFAWRLISHLSLNYLSLLDSSGDEGPKALREMLKLYADASDRQALKQIDGLRSIRSRPIVRRVQTAGPITFARGLEITALFDETAYEGQGVFLLGAVLEQFFAKYVSLNSFTETVIQTLQRKEIMRWPTQLGRRQII